MTYDQPMLGPAALPKAVARINYRLVHIPLQLIEDVAISQLDEAAPTRLAYEQFLIGCDRTAAHPLGDPGAAARAAALHAHTAPSGWSSPAAGIEPTGRTSFPSTSAVHDPAAESSRYLVGNSCPGTESSPRNYVNRSRPGTRTRRTGRVGVGSTRCPAGWRNTVSRCGSASRRTSTNYRWCGR
ncbi:MULTISPECIES: hypothetical protein [Rhodococcus]|uniref:Uncharacterized protein n=1 Tax=Rhodococcus opacus RKJ300 = JCM 13270 TaxID=1165867 RepID=I0WNR5_RHOOP|nr:hypothetical protein W59_20708 [Rhodococcus opacus RKJ300 = JCM 13270]